LSRGTRHLFLVPWHDHTLIGVWHEVDRGSPNAVELTANELERFIDEINDVYPPAQLDLGKVTACNSGLILFGNDRQKPGEHSYAKRSRLIDHAATHGIESLITVIGARYTTARTVAERVVDIVYRKLGRKPPRAVTSTTAIHGGRLQCFGEFLRDTVASRPLGLDAETVRALVHNYGSEYATVLKYADSNPALAEKLGASRVIKAEVIHGVREEMAQKLADVVFRRTDLGTAEFPGHEALAGSAALMAKELGWGNDRLQAELEQTRAHFSRFTTEGEQKAVA
jgi:glycerol-3-phosphate dehydrogenase